MRRHVIIIVSFAVAGTLASPAGAMSADAATHHQQSRIAGHGATTSASASAERKHSKKKKAKKGKPARVNSIMTGMNNAVRVSWRAAPRATRYRVKWAYAPFDKWPRATRYSPWLPASARYRIRALPTNPAKDPTMSAVPYANAVFARVQAANGKRLGAWSEWKVAWPGVPRPATGDPVRLGTYNVMLAGRENWAARLPRIAQNIAARGLGVVALQETLSTDGSGVADRLTQLTGHTWRVAPTGQTEGRILYDTQRFALTGSGKLNDYSPSNQRVVSYRTGVEIPLPWARLRALGSYRTFVVVSIHFAPSDTGSSPTARSNQQTGASARAVVVALNQLAGTSEPAVITGDFAGGYARWGDQNPAQPTLVRLGWYDAMASMSKSGLNYSTVNKLAPEHATTAVAGRADGIFLRGIRGTTRYQNVANYFMPGSHTTPSDHNLVWSEFQVPAN